LQDKSIHESRVMGRAFEFRKVRKFKRWDKMSKAFTKIGREIVIAVKLGGPDPLSNPRLRIVIQNAKGVNMPKDRIEGAIKRAASKEEGSFEELVYEGYGPHGVPMIIECATDNPTRTVATVRMHLTRHGGQLATTGSLDFMFNRKGVFRLPKEGQNLEELELELIDFGAEDVQVEDEEIVIYTSFADFAGMSKALEEKGIHANSSKIQRIPTVMKTLGEEQVDEVLELVDDLEEEDDVQAVYHNLE
jgi:YebC/PmpR family DNA-binding regulatory protein